MGFNKKKGGGSAESTYVLQVSQVTGGARACVIEIAGSHSLEQLHQAIHDAIGPRQLEAWEFQAGGRSFNDNRNRTYGPDDAGQTTIDELKLKPEQFFGYVSQGTYLIEIQGVQRSSRGFDDPRVVSTSGEAPPPRSAPAKPAPARPAPVREPVEAPGRDAQAAACSYLLVALLQRLERAQPGLAQDLLDGVEADRAGLPEEVFDEALKILRRSVDSRAG